MENGQCLYGVELHLVSLMERVLDVVLVVCLVGVHSAAASKFIVARVDDVYTLIIAAVTCL